MRTRYLFLLFCFFSFISCNNYRLKDKLEKPGGLGFSGGGSGILSMASVPGVLNFSRGWSGVADSDRTRQ